MNKIGLSAVTLLKSEHERVAFDSGSEPLNSYLKAYALQNQKRNMVRNYVCCDRNNSVKGFYSLTYGQLTTDELPSPVTKGIGKYPIPVMILARLGVDKEYQGLKLGSALLKDAILRTMQAAEIAGLKLLLVHAKDNQARAFYERHGFEPSLLDPLKMFLPMNLIKP
jgi:GNAT superfamily N-acetyltransferase